MGVALRCGGVLVAQKRADDRKACPACYSNTCKAVAQIVNADVLQTGHLPDATPNFGQPLEETL